MVAEMQPVAQYAVTEPSRGDGQTTPLLSDPPAQYSATQEVGSVTAVPGGQ